MGDNGHASTLTTFPLSAFDPQPVNWLWPGRFPSGKVSLLQGDPSTGKSYLTLDIAARVSAGRHWPDGSGQAPQGRVLLLNGEDDPADTLRPRLDLLGGDPAAVEIIGGVQPPKSQEDIPFALDEHLAVLREHLAAGPVRLLVVDPVSAFLGQIDSHCNSEVRALLGPLAGIAAAHGTAIVCVTHLNKSPLGKAVYRGMGSLAFTAAARAVWQLSRDREDRLRRLLLPVKCNLAEDVGGLAFRIEDGVIRWEADPIMTNADEVLAAEQRPHEPGAVLEARRFLTEVLADGPVPSRQVWAEAQELGIGRRALDRARSDLGIVVSRAGGLGGNGRWQWEPPPKMYGPAQDEKARTLVHVRHLRGESLTKAHYDVLRSTPQGDGHLSPPEAPDALTQAVREWQQEHPEPPAPPSPDPDDDDTPVVPDGWTRERWAGYLRTRAERCLDSTLAEELRRDAEQLESQTAQKEITQ